ncbi:MAG: GAF domain-containing protein [Anaerolineales bacterium]
MMHSADDPSSAPYRPPPSAGLAFLLDMGYILLAVACSLLLLAAFPDIPPLAAAAFLILSALALLPLRNRIRTSLRTASGRGGNPSALHGSIDTLTCQDCASASAEWLLQLSRFFHSASDPDILLELICTQVLQRIPARSIRIILTEEKYSLLSFVCYLEDGRRRTDREGTPFPAEEDLAGDVVRNARTLITADYSEACRIRNLPERETYRAWAGAPLTTGASVIGAILLMRDDPFSGGEQALLEAIADTAGPALAKSRLDGESVRRTGLIERLLRHSRRILGATDRGNLAAMVLSGARDLLPCQAALLLTQDPSGTWSVERSAGLPPIADGFPALDIDHPFVRVTIGDHPTLIDDLPDADPLHSAIGGYGLPFLGAVSLPLRRKEKYLGWIVFWNPSRSAPLSNTEELLLNEFAAVSVAALEVAHPRQAGGRSDSTLIEELTSLQRLDQELNSADDPAGAMAITLDWARRYADAPAGLAVLCAGDAFEVASTAGYPEGSGPEAGARLPPESPRFVQVMESGKPRVDRTQDSSSPGRLPSGRSALFLPIRRGAENLGVLLLESDTDGAFPPADVEFLERLASHAAIAISNAQLYAEVRAANQAKSEFISFVAHELKTPMTSIRGYTDLVAQGAVGPVSQPQANFLSTIRLNVDRMAALVSDLNDVSRIESGRLKLEFAAVPLAAAVDEVVEALQSQIDAKDQKLTLEIPADLPPAWVDRGRLIQVLTNLLSNAYKYTPAGGALRIAAERSDNRWDAAGPPEVVHFLVQDSGLGISLQEQKSIFQKFFRSEDGKVRDIPGTGLGLHITRNLVEMHGGRIWFESELNKGSTFHFTVPAASV